MVLNTAGEQRGTSLSHRHNFTFLLDILSPLVPPSGFSGWVIRSVNQELARSLRKIICPLSCQTHLGTWGKMRNRVRLSGGCSNFPGRVPKHSYCWKHFHVNKKASLRRVTNSYSDKLVLHLLPLRRRVSKCMAACSKGCPFYNFLQG